MKAAIRKKYCSPEQIKIENVEKPIPKENEVLVKVNFTTVNRTDCANLTGKPFIMHFVLGLFKPRKAILGTDFAGTIVELGKNVQELEIGNRAFGFMDTGAASQAEYLTINAKDVFLIPKNVNDKQAAASLEGAHYAYTFIHKVKIQKDQNILINGATGAIGSALLQFVRNFDVKITAVCNTKNIDLIKSLGADKIVDYTKDDFTKDDEKYDFIFDTVGKSTYGKCQRILKNEGTYISSELGPYSQNVFLPMKNSWSKKKVIFPVPYNRQKTIPFISRMLENGNFNPVVEREYPLDKISEAYQYVISGEKTGNVVIHFS